MTVCSYTPTFLTIDAKDKNAQHSFWSKGTFVRTKATALRFLSFRAISDLTICCPFAQLVAQTPRLEPSINIKSDREQKCSDVKQNTAPVFDAHSAILP
ncbi:hypothetical protein DdX_11070 [Ditylenchus destructor]|uniref:Uncharacterized protein n=1 Tax=Ditylenchus destructor TaxID=166010 RepID=A0AAD4QYG4_9BILA|nr:hypothetical protein DdX_11070 [Ditylenchus destructor]